MPVSAWDALHVWLIRADVADDLLGVLRAVLDEPERQRAAAIRDARARRRFVAAHGATRLILGHHLGVPPGTIRWRRGPHGKPDLAHPRSDLRFNLSHSGTLAVVAVSDRRPVGVDVQEVNRSIDAGVLATRFFPDEEARWVAAARPAARHGRFTRLWVRKEACLKAAGARLLPGLRLPVTSPGATVLVRDPTGAITGDYLVRDLAVPAGFHAAAALAGDRPFRVVRHEWSFDRERRPGHASRINRPVLARNTSSRLGR
jgi:4'-phosphopantetheinyl transferase